MSRRSAPDSPWQNGMPPFALCQPSFNPMMNCSPMWGQSNVPFMGNMMTPNMMRYGDSSSSHSNFRRNFDQRDRRFQPRRRDVHQTDAGRRGNKRPRFSPRNGKRPGPRRSHSPPAKRAAKEEGKEEKVASTEGEEQVAESGENQEYDRTDGAEETELYDPAEPTHDAVEEAPEAKGEECTEDSFDLGAGVDRSQEADSFAATKEEVAPVEGEAQKYPEVEENAEEGIALKGVAKGPTEGEEGAEQHEDAALVGDQCRTPEKLETPTKNAQQVGDDDTTAKKNVAEEKPQQNASKSPKRCTDVAKKPEDKPVDRRRPDSSSLPSKRQKGKGWCTVCEANFDGSFLDHRRTDSHKRKRDQKYPKCHPCSMGFANSKQYELHCSGNFHKKNVEVQDNEFDEKSSPLGEEYLEETTAFFCTLCHVLLKPDVKDQHCRTRGHYRRHRDTKRKEEALGSKEASDEIKEKGEDDDAIFTITDEIVSDDEGKGDSAEKQQHTSEGCAEEPAGEEEQPLPDVAAPPLDSPATDSISSSGATAQVNVSAENLQADDKTNGDAVLETSVSQSVDEEMSGYKTADDATPDVSAAVNSSKATNATPTSTPKSSEGTNRGRTRGPIGRGRAVRGRRR